MGGCLASLHMCNSSVCCIHYHGTSRKYTFLQSNRLTYQMVYAEVGEPLGCFSSIYHRETLRNIPFRNSVSDHLPSQVSLLRLTMYAPLPPRNGRHDLKRDPPHHSQSAGIAQYWASGAMPEVRVHVRHHKRICTLSC